MNNEYKNLINKLRTSIATSRMDSGNFKKWKYLSAHGTTITKISSESPDFLLDDLINIWNNLIIRTNVFGKEINEHEYQGETYFEKIQLLQYSDELIKIFGQIYVYLFIVLKLFQKNPQVRDINPIGYLDNIHEFESAYFQKQAVNKLNKFLKIEGD